MASDNTQCHAIGNCFTKHTLAGVCDLMVLISLNNQWKHEYGSNLAIISWIGLIPFRHSREADE
jgi:hypothetical protein